MSPQPKMESASFLAALYCLIMIQAVSRESKHKHNFGQTLKLQSAVVTLNISSRSSKYNKLFSATKQCIYASLVEKTPLIQKTELIKG